MRNELEESDVSVNTHRKTAVIVGIFFITATVAGLLGAVFSAPFQAQEYLSAIYENANQVKLASLFVLIMGIAVAGISIAMSPILRKQNRGLALGYVGARLLEGVMYIITVFSWLLLIVLSEDFIAAGAPAASHFQSMGNLLLSVSNWAGHVILDVAVMSVGALIFYSLLYRTKLVPTWLSIWGLIGAPLWLSAGLLAMYGHDPTSTLPVILNLPIAVNEMVLAVWLIVKGFDRSAISTLGSNKNSM